MAHHPGHTARSLDRGPWTIGITPERRVDIGVASVSRERGAGGCREVVSKPGRKESRRRRVPLAVRCRPLIQPVTDDSPRVDRHK
jgi:hypothetical protein